MKKLLPITLVFLSFFANAEQTNILASGAFSQCIYSSAAKDSGASYVTSHNVYVNESKVQQCPTQLVYKPSAETAVVYQLAVVRANECVYSQANIGEVTCK
jgi:hypothetical protein